MRHGGAVAKALVSGACFITMSAACNPNGCTPTDSPTEGNLVFTGNPGAYTILSENTFPTSPHDAWGNGVFGTPAQSPLNLFPADCSQCRTIESSFQSTPAPARPPVPPRGQRFCSRP